MARKKKGTPIHGWINIDKPKGMTSTQVIGRLRRILNAQKLGHAGTLDPLATGILPIALGEATKTIQFAQDSDKTYRFTIIWGSEYNTDDTEGEVTQTSDARPTQEAIEEAVPKFIGDIEQTPPQFSAIKIDGERAYSLARKGETVEIKSRIVTVHDLRLVEIHMSITESDDNVRESEEIGAATFEMTCGKGTYVRALARDMGRLLGCFGHISALRRTEVGVFSENNSIKLDAFEKILHSHGLDHCLLPIETVLDDIPALALTEEEMSRIRYGQDLKFLSRPDFDRLEVAGIDETTKLILAIGNDRPLGLLEKRDVTLHPVKLFNL